MREERSVLSAQNFHCAKKKNNNNNSQKTLTTQKTILKPMCKLNFANTFASIVKSYSGSTKYFIGDSFSKDH